MGRIGNPSYAFVTPSVHPVLSLAKGELEGVLCLKQKNFPQPLLGKEGSIDSQPLGVTSAHHAERDCYIEKDFSS